MHPYYIFFFVIMQFEEDPKNLIVPIDLAKIIYAEWDAEQEILDQPHQVYGKVLHGSGRVTFKNGNRYEGQFYNGMLHGQGKFTWSTGVVYEGEFTYNKVSGQGTYTWPDGSQYFGAVLNGLRHGDGKFVAPQESAVYTGQWANGLRHGQGQVSFKSGAFYQGDFVNGNKQGKGKMTYPTGNYYQGDFAQDKKSGYGTMNWATSNEKYYGEWRENMQNGWGTHIWLEPKGEGSKFLRNRYEGEWENAERSGVGVFYYANGAKYIGEWKNNLKCGYALFITDSGGIILGQFKQDRLSSVIVTTENEQRTGILPREIAPKTKEEQDFIQDQLSRGRAQPSSTHLNSTSKPQQQQQQDPKNPKKPKDIAQSTSNDKLAGINSPNSGTQSLLQQTGNAAAKQIEVNPYTYMIDFTDLFRGLQLDVGTIEHNVQTMLLRHNSTLRNWYKFFAQKCEQNLNENTFSLNLEGFWGIVRDAKLLNPNFTLASLNRLYHQGAKNNYPLNYQQKYLQQDVECFKKFGKKIHLNDINDIYFMEFAQRVSGSINYDQFDQNQSVGQFDKQVVDIHDPQTTLLFRHFVELLVRLAYIKYGSLNELHRAIERIILNKITPYYERKKGKGINQSQEESRSMSAKNKINFEDYVKEFKPLFEKFATFNTRPQFGCVDQTIKLSQVFYILETAGLLTDVDKTFIVAHIEKYFDTEEGTLNQPSALDQSTTHNNVTMKEEGGKPKRTRAKKAVDDSNIGGGGFEMKDSMKNLNRVEKWAQYMNNELLLYEFTDVVVAYLAKKNKEFYHPKEEEQRARVQTAVRRLMAVRVRESRTVAQPRVLLRTVKDQQKDDLKNLRIQQEARARQKKLNEEERKREERERNLMALEDQDVKSDFEEEEGSEDDDY